MKLWLQDSGEDESPDLEQGSWAVGVPGCWSLQGRGPRGELHRGNSEGCRALPPVFSWALITDQYMCEFSARGWDKTLLNNACSQLSEWRPHNSLIMSINYNKVLVSPGCSNKWSQTGCLNTTEMHSLTALEAKSLKWSVAGSLWSCRKNSSLPLSSFVVVTAWCALQLTTPVSPLFSHSHYSCLSVFSSH